MRPFAALLGAALVATANPAIAGGREQLPVLHPSLRVGVVGFVSADCALSQGAHNIDIEDFQDPTNDTVRAATAHLPFSVSCNTPISVSLSSNHGGLRFRGAGTSDPAFTTLIPYSAHVSLPGHARLLLCRSADMADRHGCEGQVADAVTVGDGAIDVRLQPSNALVLSGTYEDRLTITVTPTLGGSS